MALNKIFTHSFIHTIDWYTYEWRNMCFLPHIACFKNTRSRDRQKPSKNDDFAENTNRYRSRYPSNKLPADTIQRLSLNQNKTLGYDMGSEHCISQSSHCTLHSTLATHNTIHLYDHQYEHWISSCLFFERIKHIVSWTSRYREKYSKQSWSKAKPWY